MTRCTRRLVPLAALLAAALGCSDGGVTPQRAVVGGDARRGARVILSYGCGSCHVIPGVPAAEGRVGPPLTHFADRTFIAGRLRNEPEALVRWIRDPQAVDSLTAMPDLGVTDQQARDAAAYLYTLTADRLGPPRLIPTAAIPGH